MCNLVNHNRSRDLFSNLLELFHVSIVKMSERFLARCRIQSLRFVKIEGNEDIRGKVEHVLLSTTIRSFQQATQISQSVAEYITWKQERLSSASNEAHTANLETVH